MWDTFIQHLPSSTACLPLIEAGLLWSSLVTFDYAFEAHNTLFDIWGFANLLAWLSLGHGSDTMLDEHDSPQLYNIGTLEKKKKKKKKKKNKKD